MVHLKGWNQIHRMEERNGGGGSSLHHRKRKKRRKRKEKRKERKKEEKRWTSTEKKEKRTCTVQAHHPTKKCANLLMKGGLGRGVDKRKGGKCLLLISEKRIEHKKKVGNKNRKKQRSTGTHRTRPEKNKSEWAGICMKGFRKAEGIRDLRSFKGKKTHIETIRDKIKTELINDKKKNQQQDLWVF